MHKPKNKIFPATGESIVCKAFASKAADPGLLPQYPINGLERTVRFPQAMPGAILVFH